jgi:hypothetical protein
MPCDATRTTILSWGSSLLQGVTRSTRRAPLDARHLSWGSFPYSASGGWSLRDLCQTVPSVRLRSVRRVSRPLDGLLLHPPSTPFGVVTLVGFSLQGLPLPNRPMSSSLTGPLMTFFPRTAHSPPRKERTKGAKSAFLGWSAVLRLYRLQGLTPFESPFRAGTRLSISPPADPLLGFILPRAFPLSRPRDFHPRRSRASLLNAQASSLAGSNLSVPQLHPSVSCPVSSAVLSRDRLPFRGFPPSDPHPYEVAQFWLITLRFWPQAPGGVAAP